MQSITQLESNSAARPNSIEINQALADAYVQQGRWQDAVDVYRTLLYQGFPKWAAVLYLAGWILFVVLNQQASNFGLILIGMLIAIGGVELARSIWVQAPLQFTPAVNSAQKAAS